MTDKKTRFKKFAKWVLFRFPLFLIVSIVIMIGALKLVERYPDPLREGFEEYLSQSSHTNATIGELEDIKFFPDVTINLRELTMHNRSNAAIIDLRVEEAKISAPFWSMLFGGSRLNSLNIKGLEAVEEQLTPLSLKLDSVSIEDREGPDQYGSFLIAVGQYGSQKMNLEAEIKKKGKGYKIPKLVPFSLQVGSVSLSASLDKRFASVVLSNVVYQRAGKISEVQEYILVDSSEYNKDNPLSCLFENGDTNICNIYLEKKDP